MARQTSKAPSRSWLYGPFILVALLFAAYSAYWFFAKGQIETGINDWIAEQRSAGATVEYASKRVHGYPYRFALTVEKPQYKDQTGATDWAGQKLQIAMQPWNFNHAIIRSSGRNEIVTPDGQNLTALLGPRSALSLQWNSERITAAGLTLDTADIIMPAGDLSASNLQAAFTETTDPDVGNRLSIDWDRVTLDQDLFGGTDLISTLGTELQASRLRLEGKGFGIFGTGPDRKAEIAQLLFNWGPLKLGAKGKFDINREGYPDGTLQVRLDDADTLKDKLQAAGLLGGETAILVDVIGAGSANNGFVPIPMRDGAVTYFGQNVAPVPQVAPPL